MIIWRGEGMRNREDVVLFGPGMKGEGDHEKRQFSGHPVNGEVGGSLAIQVRSVFALEFS